MKQEGWFEKHKAIWIILIIIGTIVLTSIIIVAIIPKEKSSDLQNSNANNLNPNQQNTTTPQQTPPSQNSGYLECTNNNDCSSNEECKNNKCVEIVRADILGHSRNKPAPINTTLTIYFGYGFSQTVNAEITLLNIKRGNTAWNALKEANMFNDVAAEGKQFLLAKFRVKIINTSDGNAYSLNSYDFEAVSSEGVVYESRLIIPPDPTLSKELYSGATHEGWTAFEVDKTDANPLISFNRNQNNQDELWFSLK